MSLLTGPAVVVNHYAVGSGGGLWTKNTCKGKIYNYITCKSLGGTLGVGRNDITELPERMSPIEINREGIGYSAWYHSGLERVLTSNGSVGNIKWYCTYNGPVLKSPISVAVASALQNSVRKGDTMQPLNEHKALASDIRNVEDVRITNPLNVPGLAKEGSKGQFSNLVVIQAFAEGRYTSRPDFNKRVIGPLVTFVWSYDES